MWGSAHYNLPTLSSYRTAEEYWAKVKPWRGEGPDALRPLGSNRSRNFSIHKQPDGAIACILYRTDVVTYYPDGSIRLIPYATKTTNEFAREVLPGGISPSFAHQLGCLVWLRDAGTYLIDREVRL